jgi:hypothetical protein
MDFTPNSLRITEQAGGGVILAVVHAGKHWEIDIRVDSDEDLKPGSGTSQARVKDGGMPPERPP